HKAGVFLFFAALSTACGQKTATAEDPAAIADDAAKFARDVSEAGRARAEPDNAQAAGDAGQAGGSLLSAEPVSTAVATVTALPLKRGFYVAAGTTCGEASNATL